MKMGQKSKTVHFDGNLEDGFKVNFKKKTTIGYFKVMRMQIVFMLFTRTK